MFGSGLLLGEKSLIEFLLWYSLLALLGLIALVGIGYGYAILVVFVTMTGLSLRGSSTTGVIS